MHTFNSRLTGSECWERMRGMSAITLLLSSALIEGHSGESTMAFDCITESQCHTAIGDM